MKHRTEQLIVFVLLVAAAVGLRLYFREIPNFAPIAAVALFAGSYFRSTWLALLAPVSAMAISDQFVGGYQPLLMVTVYGFLALPAFLGRPLRGIQNRRGGLATSVSVVTFSLASSLLFFAATNFSTWLVTEWYPRTPAGLWQCYVGAIPFFRYTLTGDLFFAGALFGSYALLRAAVPQKAADFATAAE